MPERLDDALHELRERAHGFALEHLLPAERAVLAGDMDEDRARAGVIAAATRAGLYGMTQPRSHGGSEAGPLALCVVREALASHNPRWLGWAFGARPGVLGEAAEPLRSSHLLPMLAGTRRAGFGFTEPANAAFYTRARRDGEWLVIDGQKSYVTGGGEVDFVNALVDVEHEGRAFVVIDTELPGVQRERLFETLDGSVHAAFRFDSVRVPASCLIGTPGQGMPRAMRQIGDTRLLMAAEAVGRSIWCIEHLTERLRRNARPNNEAADTGSRIADNVRLRYGDLRIRVYAARSTLYRAARHAEACLRDGGNSVNEVMAAKLVATETLGQIVDETIQMVGGSALIADHPLARLYRQARVLRVAEGLSDVLRLNTARGALDLDKGTL